MCTCYLQCVFEVQLLLTFISHASILIPDLSGHVSEVFMLHIIVGSSHFILQFVVIVLNGMLIKNLSLRILCSYFLLKV